MTEPRRRRIRLCTDPWLLLAAVAALPGVVLLAACTPAVWSPHWPGAVALLLGVVLSPILEEIVFRTGVQDALAARYPHRFGFLTFANSATAVLFGLFHLWRHPPLWALATIVPALVFGLVYERHRRLVAPIGLHAVYNLAHLALLAGVRS